MFQSAPSTVGSCTGPAFHRHVDQALGRIYFHAEIAPVEEDLADRQVQRLICAGILTRDNPPHVAAIVRVSEQGDDFAVPKPGHDNAFARSIGEFFARVIPRPSVARRRDQFYGRRHGGVVRAVDMGQIARLHKVIAGETSAVFDRLLEAHAGTHSIRSADVRVPRVIQLAVGLGIVVGRGGGGRTVEDRSQNCFEPGSKKTIRYYLERSAGVHSQSCGSNIFPPHPAHSKGF